MRILFFLFLLYDNFHCREQGPPPIDSGLFSERTYYYDLYINETTLYLPDLDPKYKTFQAVYITGPLKITARELTVFFQRFDIFEHGIRVNNTNLEDLSFLKPYIVNQLDNSQNSIEITNNPNLTKIGIDFDACRFCSYNILISNNPMLDLKSECEMIINIYASRRVITDNLVDCGCTIKGSFNKFITTMAPNCWMLFGNVTIDQDSDLSILQEKMVNVTKINGGLTVTNTNFTNLSFLSSIKLIEIDAFKFEYLASIVITNNANLVSLNMTAKRNGLYLTIRDNPKLCVTPQDLDILFYGLSLDSNLDINVCYDAETPSYWCQLPASGYFSELPEGCINVTGNLMLDEKFDFDNSYKLYDIEMIYGSLTVKNTSLRYLNMLPKLLRIRSIKDGVIPLLVYNNTMLKQLFEYFTIKGMESGLPATITNNINLEVYEILCSYLKTRKTVVATNNRDNCGDNKKLQKRKYDRTPLNIDVYKGVPTFLQVSHGTGDSEDGGAQNNPWDRNTTDPEYYEEEETIETTTESGCRDIFDFTMALVLIQIVHFYM